MVWRAVVKEGRKAARQLDGVWRVARVTEVEALGVKEQLLEPFCVPNVAGRDRLGGQGHKGSQKALKTLNSNTKSIKKH